MTSNHYEPEMYKPVLLDSGREKEYAYSYEKLRDMAGLTENVQYFNAREIDQLMASGKKIKETYGVHYKGHKENMSGKDHKKAFKEVLARICGNETGDEDAYEKAYNECEYAGGMEGKAKKYFYQNWLPSHPEIDAIEVMKLESILGPNNKLDSVHACICKHYIHYRMLVYHKPTKQLICVGKCCIKKFMMDSKQCALCGKEHKNRSNNYCKDCRKTKMIKKGEFKGKPFEHMVLHETERCFEAMKSVNFSKEFSELNMWMKDKSGKSPEIIQAIESLEKRISEYQQEQERDQLILHMYNQMNRIGETICRFGRNVGRSFNDIYHNEENYCYNYVLGLEKPTGQMALLRDYIILVYDFYTNYGNEFFQKMKVEPEPEPEPETQTSQTSSCGKRIIRWNDYEGDILHLN